MHITPTMLIHYLVKQKYPKITNIYSWAEDLVVNFKKYLIEMLSMSYVKCQKQ